MKQGQVVGVIVMLIVVSTVGWCVQNAIGDRSHTGNWGTSAGRGFEVNNIPLDPAQGVYVRFEVTSADGRPLDVYLTDMDGLQAARGDRPFDYDPANSAVNITHVSRELRLSDFREVVIMSHDENEVVRITSSADQSSYPLALMPVLQITQIICLLANLALFVLLIQSWYRYRRERRDGMS